MTSVRFDFPLRTDDRAPATLAGHLYRASGSRRGILQVLIHGVSYDHRYWDAGPVNGRSYSYAGHMTERGYDVLAIDLPATGASSRCGGDAVGFDHVAESLAHGIGVVREHLGGHDAVALVGHSLGTYVCVHTQARFPVADFLVSTSTGYCATALPSPYGPGGREKAMQEPHSWLSVEDRTRVFYHPPAADPAVIAYDNRTLRTSIPRRIWQDSVTYRADPEQGGLPTIACPVLIQLGEFDPVLPAEYAETERAHWPADTTVITEQVDGVGHSLNLHRNPEIGWSAIDRFLRT
jgi:pimeloyl-ACP methyl ester carboxylesterase